MAGWIFGSPVFTNIILPFVLMFVVVFAILEKTQILGKEKRQINAIVSFIFSLMFLAVPGVIGMTQKMIPIIGMIIIILLSFMMLFGFVGGQTGEKGLNKGLKITFGILIGISMIVMIMWATGILPSMSSFFSNDEVVSTTIFIVFIIAIFSVVLSTTPKEEGSKK